MSGLRVLFAARTRANFASGAMGTGPENFSSPFSSGAKFSAARTDFSARSLRPPTRGGSAAETPKIDANAGPRKSPIARERRRSAIVDGSCSGEYDRSRPISHRGREIRVRVCFSRVRVWIEEGGKGKRENGEAV